MSEISLFSSLNLRGVSLKNRLVLAPMMTYASNQGHLSDWQRAHYLKFANAGLGLVFIESTKIDPQGCSTRYDLGLWKDEFIKPLKELVSQMKESGATVGIQISHAGRKARRTRPWEGLKSSKMTTEKAIDFSPLDDQLDVEGRKWDLVGPSNIAYNEHYDAPKEMTSSEIREMIKTWGQAARRANESDIDILGIHGAHGYLLHEFLSPAANRRHDEYGGSVENRMRLPIEVVKEIRKYWPENKPLFYRVSAIDEAGWSVDDTIIFAQELVKYGVDIIDCSSGGITAEIEANRRELYNGYQVPFAEKIRKKGNLKTMVVGLIVDPVQAENIVSEGKADLVALGRALLHDPNWALQAAERLGLDNLYDRLGLPEAYSYWLEKLATRGFPGRDLAEG